MSRVMVGKMAPDFVLPDQWGNPVRLSDFRDKKNVIVYFYPRDFTSGCQLEAITFAENYELFRTLNTEILGVSVDSVGSHQRFSSEFKLPFPLLSDRNNRVRRAFGVSKTFGLFPGRVTYIIDRLGIIRREFSSQCNPQRHTREALRFLISVLMKDAMESGESDHPRV